MFLIRANQESPIQDNRRRDCLADILNVNKDTPQLLRNTNTSNFLLAAGKPKNQEKPKNASKATCKALLRSQPSLD